MPRTVHNYWCEIRSWKESKYKKALNAPFTSMKNARNFFKRNKEEFKEHEMRIVVTDLDGITVMSNYLPASILGFSEEK